MPRAELLRHTVVVLSVSQSFWLRISRHSLKTKCSTDGTYKLPGSQVWAGFVFSKVQIASHGNQKQNSQDIDIVLTNEA